MSDYLLLCGALLASAVFSGTEIAFTSLSSAHVLVWKRSGRRGAGLTKRYFDRPDALLIALLVGTNLANISFTSVATLLAAGRGLPEWLYVPFITLVILLLGETLPKLLFHEWANRLFPLLAYPARLFHLMFWPVVAPAALLLRLAGGPARDKRELVHLRAHLGDMAEDLGTAGQLSRRESRMIGRALHLRDRTVGELMTPRTSMIALPDTASLEEFGQAVIGHGYSCLPVYREDLDRIIGYVNARDLFTTRHALREILREVEHVPASMPARDLMIRFGRARMNLVIVLDEYGGTAGLVSLEDLLEDLVGSIEDEHDPDLRELVPLGNGRYLLAGRLRLESLEEGLALGLESDDADTVGGWISVLLGRIPQEGERLEWKGLEFRVMSATPREVRQLMLSLPDDHQQAAGRKPAAG